MKVPVSEVAGSDLDIPPLPAYEVRIKGSFFLKGNNQS